jgi:type IV pilus assembly protein PilY1
MSQHRSHTVARPRFIAAGACLSTLFALGAAHAQTSDGVEKPPPNVLLLVDTSGSMELKADGSEPVCNPGDTTPGANDTNRWIDLLQVLTGRFSGYSCWAQDRNSAGFRSEFSLGGLPSYDVGYVNAYHRALSNGCLYGPGVAPATDKPYSWPNRAVNTFPFTAGTVVRPPDLANHTGCAQFSQAPDGLLDIYNNQIRFGLMTFDTQVNAGTGVAGGNANYTTGIDGTWSYYVGAPAQGHPANCAFSMDQEVGARNAAAPPWEGRLVGFGPPNAPDTTQRNTWIQEVLLSTRPYGATPIAGLLHDARDFLWNDISPDPLDTSTPPAQFGPTNDPSWRAAKCRKTIIILLTDGEPNLDLRPFCEANPPPPGTPGKCPYARPEEIVASLRTSPPTSSLSVETYVVAFGLSKVTPAGSSEKPCAELTNADCTNPANFTASNPQSKPIQACCTLNKIAAAGGLEKDNTPRHAFFAANDAELRTIFARILNDVVQVTTRTAPVFSGAGGDVSSAGFKFFSAFDPKPDPLNNRLWKGVLQRQRFVCNDDLVPEPAALNVLQGDDFAANLASGTGPARAFYTVIGGTSNGTNIRPRIAPPAADGLGDSTATNVNDGAAGLPSKIPVSAVNVTAATCGMASDALCRDAVVNYAIGLPAGAYNRCPSSTDCELLGGVFHSTPQIVSGRPSDFLRDESYQAFVKLMEADARPTTLYTSSVDGFLHAFKVAPFPGKTGAVTTQTNNELWAFIPPAVVPVLQAQYPSPAVLLDGAPVVKDVVARVVEGTETFERLQVDAQAGSGEWRTVLAQSFGKGQVAGGYFALDVTKPASQGPKFLWQLTTTAGGLPLFGKGGTPLITTLFIASQQGPREVAVAVLPGGDAEPNATTPDAPVGPVMRTEPTTFQTLRKLRNYDDLNARSLTIVRLDNGEIIRTFRPSGAAAAFSSSVFQATEISAPIVGQPKAFPAETGAIADRVFVGDRDGRLWRLDVSSTNPSNWTMEVFFDALYDKGPGDGQPVELAPVLSVNDEGAITIAFATGDQRATGGSTNTFNRVWSLTEKSDVAGFYADVNWFHDMTGAERVTGPMVLFNRGLYYAASLPPNTVTSRCDGGSSKVYGVHYELNKSQQSAPFTDAPTSGPGLVPGLDPPATSIEVPGSSSAGMIFGVSLEARPSCASEEETTSADESFNYGSVSSSSTVNPGQFFLSFATSGTTEGTNGVQEQTVPLTAPRVPVTFESWALIYE